VIIAATVALVVGVLAGWQLGAREAEQQAELAAAADSVFPGPRTQAEYLAALPVAADSPAIEVFDRPATDADVPALAWGGGLDEASPEIRLLATGADGIPAYAIREGEEYCLFLVFEADLSASATCTDTGRFPPEGLRLTTVMQGAQSGVDVTWRPDGSIAVLVPGAALTAPTG
jgi:hypothetical protein